MKKGMPMRAQAGKKWEFYYVLETRKEWVVVGMEEDERKIKG